MCMQGCTTVITAPPPFRLNLFNRRVADAARVTCANVTPAGPDRVTTCASGTLHCYASFSILEGVLLIDKPGRNTRYVPEQTRGLADCFCVSTTTTHFRVSFFGQLGIMTVKHLAVGYEEGNERGAFSPGDVLSGKVTVVISKEIKVQCFSVKAKGKAEVTWCEREAETRRVYSDKKTYFSFEHIILQDKKKGDGWYHHLSVVARQSLCLINRSWYCFLKIRLRNHQCWKKCVSIHICDTKYVRIQSDIQRFPPADVIEWLFLSGLLPCRDMPSSYEGKWGKVTYSLRAKLTQSIWLVHKVKTDFPLLTKSEFPFASKSEMMIIGLKVWTWFSVKPASDFSKTISYFTPITHAGTPVCHLWFDRNSSTQPGFHFMALTRSRLVLPLKKWESNKVNIFTENTQSDLSCYKYDTFLLISHRGSVGCLFGGGEWLCTHSNTQILPVWETDLCCSVSTDGAHGKCPVQDRWLCSSTDHPDHHQSPEYPSRLDSHLFQLLSDEAGIQTQGTVCCPTYASTKRL